MASPDSPLLICSPLPRQNPARDSSSWLEKSRQEWRSRGGEVKSRQWARAVERARQRSERGKENRSSSSASERNLAQDGTRDSRTAIGVRPDGGVARGPEEDGPVLPLRGGRVAYVEKWAGGQAQLVQRLRSEVAHASDSERLPPHPERGLHEDEAKTTVQVRFG